MKRLIAAGVLVLIIACGNKTVAPKKDAGTRVVAVQDAGFDAAGPLAANELAVTRYEDELPIAKVAETIATKVAVVLTAYPTKGEVVATLHEGQSVVQIAERHGFHLVTFQDPTTPGTARTLMGWVAKFVFGGLGLDAGAPPETRLTVPFCSGTKVLVFQGEKPRCDYVCYAEGECLNGSTCEAAMELPKTGEVLKEPTYTTVCTPPIGAPVPAHSGVPSLFGAAHNPGDGKCPRKFVPAPKLGALCFMSCKLDKDCPQDSSCKDAPGIKEKLCFGDSVQR